MFRYPYQTLKCFKRKWGFAYKHIETPCLCGLPPSEGNPAQGGLPGTMLGMGRSCSVNPFVVLCSLFLSIEKSEAKCNPVFVL